MRRLAYGFLVTSRGQAKTMPYLAVGEVMDDLSRRPVIRCRPQVQLVVGDVRKGLVHDLGSFLVPLDQFASVLRFHGISIWLVAIDRHFGLSAAHRRVRI